MLELKITTLNIRCFGFDGDYFARNKSESRIKYLKNFILKNYSDTDIFLLQEIMDPSVLNLILPDGFKFYSYKHDYNRHMFVVLACKADFDFTNIQIIENTALDKTKSRPVLYGTFVKDDRPIAHIIALHLKSGFEHSDKRIYQCQLIERFITTLDTDLPIIMGGDFNSHFKSRTKKEQDDLFYIKEIFKNSLSLAEHNKPTYVLPTENAHLDHLWTRNADVKSIEVYKLENYTVGNSLKNYYNEISDHLPVQIKVSLQ